MKYGLYAALVLALVPIQTTLLQFVSIAGIRPDLCLITTVIIGLTFGRLEGLLMGLGLGLVQDFFSAAQLGLNLMTKGAAGLMAGLTTRYVATTTTFTVFILVFSLSAVSGLVFLSFGRGGEHVMDALHAVAVVLLPGAVFDAVLGAITYALLGSWIRRLEPAEESLARLRS